MKLSGKLILPLALAFAVSTAGVASHTAVLTTSAVPAKTPPGLELPIVMYHHVLKESSRLNKFTISPDELRQDFDFLRDSGYTPIVMQQLIDYTEKQTPLPPKPVMITFDDGYESFHEYVFPMLKEYDFKAVYSIVGRYADQYSEIDDHHIRYSHSTWNELALMHDSGLVEIQNHSYNLHENDKGRDGSTKMSGENLAFYTEMLFADLSKVQQSCREHLGWTPTTFTYPFGRISPEALPVLRQMGFKGALTCREKLNYITGDPNQLFHLNRFNRPHGESFEVIVARLK